MTCNRIDIISLFPEMFSALDSGVTGRPNCQQQINLNYWNPRDFSSDKQRRVDDRPYGGGPGMLMQIDPLAATLDAAKESSATPATVIFMSPAGTPLTQKILQKLAQLPRLIIISGRYEGVDQRFIDHCVDHTYSCGDFVVSGGELPSMMLIDGLSRMLPGVLGNECSATEDSFIDGLLDHPHYTRPAKHKLGDVPSVLINGNHKEINSWRQKQALIKTWQQRPDMIENMVLTEKQKRQLSEAQAIEED